MDPIQIVVLSLLQGFTEFLPISSSAHLIFVPKLLGWPDQGLAFDVAVHLGTLVAVLIYFRQDLLRMTTDFFKSFKTRQLTPYAKLAWWLGFATIPVGLAGILFKDFIETALRSPKVIACTTLGFAILLWLADKWGQRDRKEQNISLKDAMMIGLGQALSLIPGTSRSGITLTAGLARGLTREAAARFSFLLSVPVIALAGGYETLTLVKDKVPMDWQGLSVGFFISALSGYICIHYFLKLLGKVGVMPFVIYRALLGIVLLSMFVF